MIVTALDPAATFRRLAEHHRPLAVSGLATLALLALFLLGLVLDPRVIGGAPAWLKPTKFAVSITVYTFTLLWLLGHVSRHTPRRQRLVRITGWVVVVTFALEWLAILTQVVRGTTSHFNVAAPIDAALWGLMAVAINVLLVANVAVAGLLLTQRFERPSLGWALRLGIAITVIGMAQAFLMTSPTALQLAGWRAGEPITVVGAHTVGAPDGGAGMAVTGWRSDAGDLRVGHFVGLHALQVIPLFGLWLQRRRRLVEGQRTALVAVAAGGYLGLTALVTWQALRAQPLLRPDALTLAALALVVVACAVAALVVVRSAPTSARADAERAAPAPSDPRFGATVGRTES
jgi:hypothetical protein